MYVHLKERPYYEDIYDRHTVENARRNIVYYDRFYTELESKLDEDDTIDRPGNAVILNAFYMQAVGLELLHRYENREQYIQERMAKDEAKDDQIVAARLTEEPHCQHCHKEGLRIIDKSLMHRGNTYNIDDPEEVLFMLRCPHCEKNSAFWEDGEVWKPKLTLCPKCNSEVAHTTTRTKRAIIFTYTCPFCKHSFKEKMDFSKKEKNLTQVLRKIVLTFAYGTKDFETIFSLPEVVSRIWLDLAKNSKKKKTTSTFMMP